MKTKNSKLHRKNTGVVVAIEEVEAKDQKKSKVMNAFLCHKNQNKRSIKAKHEVGRLYTLHPPNGLNAPKNGVADRQTDTPTGKTTPKRQRIVSFVSSP